MRIKHRRAQRKTAAMVATVAVVVGLSTVFTSPGYAQEDPEAAPPPATAATDELAQTPYMGWSSYSMQVYSGNTPWLSAENLIAQSDAMHETLQPHGYEYINVDAGWNGANDEYGRPTPSTTVFPDGIEAVIDHVHDNGQKFGLYVIPGIVPAGVRRRPADLRRPRLLHG